MTRFSVRDCVDAYAQSNARDWGDDRLNTVGASEIGQCLRKVWFGKNEIDRDADYIDRHGARSRGNLIENHWIVPAIRQSHAELKYAGDEQQTIASGYLSATPDGLLLGIERDCLAWLGVPDIGADCLVVEIKSIDPRVDIKIEKPEHSFQTQVQMGLIRETTAHQPNYALINYTDASFLDDVREFAVAFDPAIYAAAKARARAVMTETDALHLPAEGKIAGGDECKYCPWSSRCGAVTIAGIPKSETQLGDNAAAELKRLRDAERELAEAEDKIETEHRKAKEDIKEFLRGNGTRGFKGDGWSVSWSSVKGRETVDVRAAEAAGFDLSPFRKVGEPAERLVVK